jgi:arylsulfatase
MPDVNEYKWELCNLTEYHSRANDLAVLMPDEVKELQAVFMQEAQKYNVVPLATAQT